MRWRRFWQCLLIFLVAVLAWSPALPVVAQDPPPPTLRGPLPTLAPAQPAACPPPPLCLYDQTDSPKIPGSGIIAQDSVGEQYDTQAADDFFVNPSSNSWQITELEVAGKFNGGDVTQAISAITFKVVFYADAGGLPGYQLYSANVQLSSITTATVDFILPLSPTVRIASNAIYWVSVQAVQSSSWYWYWTERGTQSQSASAWRNPGNSFITLTSCVNWTALNQCFLNEGPDLLFRLYGTQSSSQVTPVLISLDPNAAIHRSFALNAYGLGFANGAKIDFGPTYHFSTALSGSTQLSALVPAAAVSGSYNSTLTVTVTNPGPCGGSCISNALLFTLANRTYAPLIHR